ncbi:Formyl-CoA:oxalate CoA-transferase [compost metagenome]
MFETTDGAIVMVGAFKQNPLRDICTALEIEDLSLRPQFADFDAQMQRRPELQQVFREAFAKNSSAHWLGRLEQVDILCAPVRSLPEALDDEQTVINGMILHAGETKAGPIRLVGSPIDMSAATVTVRIAPPKLGEHNDEILSGLPVRQGDAA